MDIIYNMIQTIELILLKLGYLVKLKVLLTIIKKWSIIIDIIMCNTIVEILN